MNATAPDVTTIDRVFAALADPVRRNILESLALATQSSGELARNIGVSAPTMSKHLRILREANLVSQSHPAFDTRIRIYALHDAPLAELRQWLARAEAGWSEQLASFARHVEASQ